MPLVSLPSPTNCWPYHIDQLTAALCASAQFQAMVGAVDAIAAGQLVFGKRMTHSRGGRVWKREDLLELKHFGMVQSDAYGKRLGDFGRYLPFGADYLWLQRLLPIESLYDNGDGPNPTDVQEREWQNITGTICDQIVAYFDANGPTGIVDRFELVVDSSTHVTSVGSEGMWQEHEYMLTWSEK